MRKVYKSFAAALLLTLGLPTQAIEPVDGVYKIGTAAELKEFAELVKGGQTAINAELTADIDYTSEFTHIGVVDANGDYTNESYTGTFDGKGHTITYEVESDMISGSSLFHVFSGTIQNLNVAGSITSTAQYAGSIAYRMEVDGQLLNCSSSMTITAKDFYEDAPACNHGGLLGYQVGSGLMQGCAFTGRFAGAVANKRGGLIGWCAEGNGVLTLNSCLVVADLDGSLDLTDSDNFFTHNVNAGSKQKLSNCVYLNDMGHTLTTVDGIQTREEALASGEACFVLNGRSSEEPIWFQNLPGDALPTTDASHGVVYVGGHQHCNGADYEGATTYSNTNTGIQKDDHNFVDGLCDYCHLADINHLPLSADGFYELSTAADMVWFASLVNSGLKSDANGRVMNTIDMDGVEWTPIGSRIHQYEGTFDGQLMPITNLNGMYFGTTGVARINGLAYESGEATNPSEDIALHTGSLVGFANGETILTNSYSKAHVVASRGDKGAISGKFWGTMDHVYFAGTFTDGVSGLISSSNESVRPAHIKNCYVNTESVGSGWSAAFVAWQHGNSTLDNCWVVADAFGTKYFEHGDEGTNTNYGTFTKEEATNGALAWKLNGNTFLNATWFQSLDEDEEMPCLDSTHGLVYPYKGEFKSAGEDISEMKSDLIEENTEYTEAVLAYQETIKAFVEALNATAEITDRNEFAEAYYAALELRAEVEKSEKAYTAYCAAVNDVYTKCKDANLGGETADLIVAYFEDEIEPDETFPNGSFLYIKEHKQLNDEQIAAETDFVKKLLEQAILEDYKAGDEISNLLVNANLYEKPNFTGWTYEKTGSTFTVGNPTREILPGAESWQAVFDMHQTVSGLKDGLYELQVNAVYRPHGDHYNTNYAAWAYAGENAVNVMVEGEDAVLQSEAVHGVNCYLENDVYEGLVDNEYYNEEGEACWIPAGPQSCTFAFLGGRYVNTIVAKAVDGELTVGLRNVGTGQSNDWCGFGNFRLFYRGTLDSQEAATSLDKTLAGMAARAKTLIATEPSTSAEAAMPSFSKALKDELQAAIDAIPAAANGEQKYALVQKFTELYQKVYECKQAYIAMMAELESYANLALNITQVYPEAEAQADAMSTLIDDMMDKWVDGAYSIEETVELAEIKNSALYKFLQENLPAQDGGYFLLANVEDLQWFADMVNKAMPNINGRLTAAIDFGEVENTPIGTDLNRFSGKFDGQLYPISGLQHPFFGIISNATIEGLAIEECEIHGVGEGYSNNTGAIACEAHSSTVQNSYTKARVTQSGNDTGGMFGKIHTNMIIRNCLFAGSVSVGWSAACVTGSTNSSNSIADLAYCFIDARNMGRNNGDGHGLLVGWEHGVPAGSIHDIYVIASPTLTNFFGHQETARIDRVEKIEPEVAASGETTFLLNEAQGATAWFQTLGEDETPVLDKTHKVVVKNDDDTYSNVDGSAIEMVEVEKELDTIVNVYDMNGRLIRSGVKTANSLNGLPKGIYVIKGKKVLK